MRSSCSTIVALVAAAAVTFGSSAITAQGRGKGPSAPKPASHPAPPVKSPASTGVQGPKGPKSGPSVTPPAKGQSPKGQSPKTTPPGQSEKGRPANTVVTTATVQEQLASKPQLRTRLVGLLPPGTDINLAAAGFKNFGQFVAAVHVSRNLGIPFDQLKARMTGPQPMSLGQAITQLKPGLNNIETEVRRAENEANEDLQIRKR